MGSRVNQLHGHAHRVMADVDGSSSLNEVTRISGNTFGTVAVAWRTAVSVSST
jgi:hypothetical protein